MKPLDPRAQLPLFTDPPPLERLPAGACALCQGSNIGLFDFNCAGCQERHARLFPPARRPLARDPR